MHASKNTNNVRTRVNEEVIGGDLQKVNFESPWRWLELLDTNGKSAKTNYNSRRSSLVDIRRPFCRLLTLLSPLNSLVWILHSPI